MEINGTVQKSEIIDTFGKHVSSGKVAFYEAAGIDFILGRREGVYMWDLDGRRLINCHCNGGVFNLGHRNPRVIAALEAGLRDLDIGNHHLISAARAELAERLAATTSGALNRVVFGVSGGEAIDLAIKLARAATGRKTIISADGGYHGHTGFALAAGDDQYKAPFKPLPGGFRRAPFGDSAALEEILDEQTAAVLLETIPATAGIVQPPERYFLEVRELCDRSGALMMMDEVQTGLGRCGALWGINTYHVLPDIIVTGKGLSGGIYPITATLYKESLNPFLHENPFIHISTFGGAELGCLAALEVLNILDEPGFLEHVAEMAGFFETGFGQLQSIHGNLLAEIRQRGLMMGLKMTHPQAGPLMSRLGFEAGIFAVYANNDPSVLQLLPPLIIEEEQAEAVLVALDQMLETVTKLIGASHG